METSCEICKKKHVIEFEIRESEKIHCVQFSGHSYKVQQNCNEFIVLILKSFTLLFSELLKSILKEREK